MGGSGCTDPEPSGTPGHSGDPESGERPDPAGIPQVRENERNSRGPSGPRTGAKRNPSRFAPDGYLTTDAGVVI